MNSVHFILLLFMRRLNKTMFGTCMFAYFLCFLSRADPEMVRMVTEIPIHPLPHTPWSGMAKVSCILRHQGVQDYWLTVGQGLLSV